MSELLTDHDRAYLVTKGLSFDERLEGGMILLIIKDYRLPVGYQPAITDLLLRLAPQFPEVGPDMFWMDPAVAYVNGRAPAATQLREQYAGRTWQRWSRHLTQTRWRAGTDDLRSYLRLTRSTLEREVAPLAA